MKSYSPQIRNTNKINEKGISHNKEKKESNKNIGNGKTKFEKEWLSFISEKYDDYTEIRKPPELLKRSCSEISEILNLQKCLDGPNTKSNNNAVISDNRLYKKAPSDLPESQSKLSKYSSNIPDFSYAFSQRFVLSH